MKFWSFADAPPSPYTFSTSIFKVITYVHYSDFVICQLPKQSVNNEKKQIDALLQIRYPTINCNLPLQLESGEYLKSKVDENPN